MECMKLSLSENLGTVKDSRDSQSEREIERGGERERDEVEKEEEEEEEEEEAAILVRCRIHQRELPILLAIQ